MQNGEFENILFKGFHLTDSNSFTSLKTIIFKDLRYHRGIKNIPLFVFK